MKIDVNIDQILSLNGLPGEVKLAIENSQYTEILTSLVKRDNMYSIYSRRVEGLLNTEKGREIKNQIESFLKNIANITNENIYMTLVKNSDLHCLVFYNELINKILGVIYL